MWRRELPDVEREIHCPREPVISQWNLSGEECGMNCPSETSMQLHAMDFCLHVPLNSFASNMGGFCP